MDIRNKFKKLFTESVDYQPPVVDAPTEEPAIEIVINKDFLHGILTWAGVESNACCQLVQSACDKAAYGPLTGDTVHELTATATTPVAHPVPAPVQAPTATSQNQVDTNAIPTVPVNSLVVPTDPTY